MTLSKIVCGILFHQETWLWCWGFEDGSSLKMLVFFFDTPRQILKWFQRNMFLGWPFLKTPPEILFLQDKWFWCGGTIFAPYIHEEIIKILVLWNQRSNFEIISQKWLFAWWLYSKISWWNFGLWQSKVNIAKGRQLHTVLLFCLIFLSMCSCIFKKWPLGDLSQNLFLELWFVKKRMILFPKFDYFKSN